MELTSLHPVSHAQEKSILSHFIIAYIFVTAASAAPACFASPAYDGTSQEFHSKDR